LVALISTGSLSVPQPPEGDAMSDQFSLFESAVSALTRFFVGNQTLGQSLHQVSELTLQAVPGAHHVGITLLVADTLKTSVFTHPEVPEIDQAQYRTGDGPCVDAYRNGETYRIESTQEPGRWQEFRDSAARHGVLSTLSLPLKTEDTTIGAMNLYAEVEGAFDEDNQRVAELFATQAAFLLANAQAYWDARSLSENLTQAMESRAEIEQAKGIIMATTGTDADGAFEQLKAQSQYENVKLREIAREIVERTSRRHPDR
jgi:GAF domain-containing protein